MQKTKSIQPHEQDAQPKEDSIKMQQNDGKMKLLIEDALAFGDLCLISNKGTGKTNALMVLAHEFAQLEDTRVIIFEDFPKWSKEFDTLPFMVIHDSDVIETKHTISLDDSFLTHDKDFTVKRGTEINEALETNKNLIFMSRIEDIDREAFFIYSVIAYFYRRNYLRLFKNYQKKERIVFFIEESQNVFDSSTISRKVFNRLRKIFSVARNLDLHFVLCSQWLQDLNTKIRTRTRLLIGQVSLDDYSLKIRSLLRNSKFRDQILTLDVGQFLYTGNDSLIKFDKFEGTGKPYELQKPQKPKRKSLIEKLKEWLQKKKQRKQLTISEAKSYVKTVSECQARPQNEETEDARIAREQNEDDEEDELTEEEEWF
jgi:hypothetical protein